MGSYSIVNSSGKRYKELKLMEQKGLIKDLELQPKFELIPAFVKNRKKYRVCNYFADFSYTDVKTGNKIVEDVKGFRTKVYAIKKKLFEYNYPDLEIVEILK